MSWPALYQAWIKGTINSPERPRRIGSERASLLNGSRVWLINTAQSLAVLGATVGVGGVVPGAEHSLEPLSHRPA